ncbi:MAG TPA: T9SS type A sorting domain-containing protein [Ignavibacteriaceae bacterium]|nr:T9SS type A sorting domain-containing protein [Ignavibacteriaceae bacterium]
MKMHPITFISILLLLIISSFQVQAQWHEQTSPIATTLYTVSVVDDSVAWAGGTGGKVLRTVDGGITWTQVGAGALGTDDVYNIFGIDSSNALCTTSSTTTYIYKTTDGGATWTQVFSQVGGFMDAIWMFDSDNGFAYGDPVGGTWELYKTSDGGNTWTPAASLPQDGTEAGWNNAMYVSDPYIYFGTNNSRIYYSTDRGATWTIQTITYPNSYSIWFNDSNRGMMGGSQLNQTTDGGMTWTALNNLPSTGSINSLTGKDNMWWVARQANVIYNSTDNGATWDSQYVSPTAGLYFAMARSRDPQDSLIIAVRNDGGISAYGPSGPTGVKQDNNTPIPLTFNLAQNYPNPFNPSTRIEFNVPETGNVKLTVYNVLGQEVAVLVNGMVTAGLHTATFNASSLPSGTYIYKLQSNNSVMVKKMMLMK